MYLCVRSATSVWSSLSKELSLEEHIDEVQQHLAESTVEEAPSPQPLSTASVDTLLLKEHKGGGVGVSGKDTEDKEKDKK